MIYPGVLALRCFDTLGFDDGISIIGIDLTGAEVLMQVRLYPGAAGDPLIALEMVEDVSIDEGLDVSVDFSPGYPVSTIRWRIDRGTIGNLPQPAKAAADSVLAYDIITTGVGFEQCALVRGDFIVERGVTEIPA